MRKPLRVWSLHAAPATTVAVTSVAAAAVLVAAAAPVSVVCPALAPTAVVTLVAVVSMVAVVKAVAVTRLVAKASKAEVTSVVDAQQRVASMPVQRGVLSSAMTAVLKVAQHLVKTVVPILALLIAAIAQTAALGLRTVRRAQKVAAMPRRLPVVVTTVVPPLRGALCAVNLSP